MVEEAFGALDPKRERHLQWRRLEMRGKQAREVTRSYAEPFGERIDAIPVQITGLDASQRPLDGGPGALPCRTERGRLRSAAQAGPIAGALRGCGAGIEADVARKRSARRTHRAAIYPGRLDCHEHHAIQRGVAPAACFVILSSEIDHGAAIQGMASQCELPAMTTSGNDRLCAAAPIGSAVSHSLVRAHLKEAGVHDPDGLMDSDES